MLESPIPTFRIPASNGRFYTPKLSDKDSFETPVSPIADREARMGVTTFLDKAVPKGMGMIIAAGNGLDWEHTRKKWDGLAQDGTLVHALTDRLAEGETIPIRGSEWWDSEEDKGVPVEWRHYRRLEGYRNFWNDHNPEVLAAELQLYHPDLFFAGTLDNLFEIDKEIWLVDKKTGKQYDDHELQITCYGMLCRAHGIKVDRYACLYLPDGWKTARGSYTLKPYKYRPDIVMHYYKTLLWKEPKAFKPNLKPELPEEFSLVNDTASAVDNTAEEE